MNWVPWRGKMRKQCSKGLAFYSGLVYEELSFSALLYYINSPQYICTAFIITHKRYFWRKQNLRGHSDFVLFVLSLILAQGTLNIWAQTHERFILGNSTWLLSVWWFSDLLSLHKVCPSIHLPTYRELCAWYCSEYGIHLQPWESRISTWEECPNRKADKPASTMQWTSRWATGVFIHSWGYTEKPV